MIVVTGVRNLCQESDDDSDVGRAEHLGYVPPGRQDVRLSEDRRAADALLPD